MEDSVATFVVLGSQLGSSQTGSDKVFGGHKPERIWQLNNGSSFLFEYHSGKIGSDVSRRHRIGAGNYAFSPSLAR